MHDVAYNECLDLMHRLMTYRHEPIHSKLMKIRDKYYMLHLDVLILIYHFAKLCSGATLEIGAFVGGATIAAALGIRDSGQEKKLIAVEPGGSVKHKRLGTRNILRDLERNLAREDVANMVHWLKDSLSSRKRCLLSVMHSVRSSRAVNPRCRCCQTQRRRLLSRQICGRMLDDNRRHLRH